MKIITYILVACCLLLATYSHAQLLFYQDTYKGGVTSDGISYYSYDYLQADTIHFQVHIPIGSTIRKSFLISQRANFIVGKTPMGEAPLQVSFNNHTVSFDSSAIVTSRFTCDDPSDLIWMVVKDVTSYTQLTANKLIVPSQSILLATDPKGRYVYDGFLLIITYNNASLTGTNAAIYLNNNYMTSVMNESLTNLNPVNIANDVGLSIWTHDVYSSPEPWTLSYVLNSTLGNFNLGTLDQYAGNGTWKKTLPGSFYYENNTLFGLVDDTPDAFIDSTDALANIKTYLSNSTNSFSLTSNGNVTGDCDDSRNAYILAYTTPCPARDGKDSTYTYTICTGSNTQLTSSTIPATGINYSWYATDGSVNSITTASVVVTPTVSTNYIAYVDSAGCKHTEHFKVNVYTLPKIDSLKTSNALCGGPKGSAVVYAKNGTKPYSYNIGIGNQSSNVFSNLLAGTYTLSLTDSAGCTVPQQSFTITETNPVVASFSLSPNPACVNEPVAFTNTSTNTNNQWWNFGTNDTTNTQNPSYMYSDTGTYQITLIAWYNLRPCSDTITNTIHIKDCPPDSIHITVPNIFTPNADGVNDSWQLAVSSYQYTVSNYQCNIYDRWGIQVFSSASLNEAWTGRTTSGESASAGSYFYLVKLTQTNSKGVSENKEFKGYLELLR